MTNNQLLTMSINNQYLCHYMTFDMPLLNSSMLLHCSIISIYFNIKVKLFYKSSNGCQKCWCVIIGFILTDVDIVICNPELSHLKLLLLSWNHPGYEAVRCSGFPVSQWARRNWYSAVLFGFLWSSLQLQSKFLEQTWMIWKLVLNL